MSTNDPVAHGREPADPPHWWEAPAVVVVLIFIGLAIAGSAMSLLRGLQ